MWPGFPVATCYGRVFEFELVDQSQCWPGMTLHLRKEPHLRTFIFMRPDRVAPVPLRLLSQKSLYTRW